MARSRARRTVLVAAVALLALVATACGADRSTPPAMPPEPPGPATTASPGTPTSSPSGSASTSPRQTSQEAAMRTRLADALRPGDPVSAGVVANPSTRLTVVATDWLPGWQVVDVLARTVPHGQRFAVGLSAQGQARYLSGRPDEFDAMVTSARPEVTAGSVVTLTRTFLDVTRTFEHWSYRIEEVGAIEWRPGLTPAEQQVRDRVEQTYAHQVQAPRATPAGAGWTVTAWMVDDTTLVRHDLAVAANGSTTDTATVVERDLPVPASI